MITFEEAYRIVMENVSSLGTEKIPMTDALGRILAMDVHSDMDMPPFDKSAMDGYACRMQDIHEELEVIEVIPAGRKPEKVIGSKQCAKIMTGAMIPIGADCVLMVEQTAMISDHSIRFSMDKSNPNICYRAEDISKGEMVLKKGTLIRSQHVAVMASVGCTHPLVSYFPKVGIVTTGEELVEPHQQPGISEIRNSNGYQLITQLKEMRISPQYYGIVGDSENSALNTMQQAHDENDVLILTGGVSMGDFDRVPELLNKLDIKIYFRKVAVQPGKPTTFGKKNQKLCFGLPGNPVSSFIQFEILVKPALYKMMGNDFQAVSLSMKMGKDLKRWKAERMSLIPVKVSPEGKVFPLEYHGSAHINALTSAFGIIAIPINTFEIKEGENVDVRPL